MSYQDEFRALYKKYITREGADKLLDWLETTDFMKAPASTRFHEAYEGGLAEHSVQVWHQLVRLLKAFPEVKVSGETASIVSLLHDICKVNCYKVEMRNKKINGVWEQVPFYTFKEDFCFGGHGSKSVYVIQSFMQLSDEEAVAINCHMGVENGNYAVNDAYRMYPLAFLVHTADMAATLEALHIK